MYQVKRVCKALASSNSSYFYYTILHYLERELRPTTMRGLNRDGGGIYLWFFQ